MANEAQVVLRKVSPENRKPRTENLSTTDDISQARPPREHGAAAVLSGASVPENLDGVKKSNAGTCTLQSSFVPFESLSSSHLADRPVVIDFAAVDHAYCSPPPHPLHCAFPSTEWNCGK